MTDTLTFQVQSYPVETDDGSPYLQLKVVPLINDVQLMAHEHGPLFDAAEVLARQLDAGSFYPFTCSCGVPGCAGIFDATRLSQEAGTVSWLFPEEPFRELFSKELTHARTALKFTFSDVDYAKALHKLGEQIISLATTQPLPVNFEVGSYPDEERLAMDIRSVLAEDRKAFLYHQEREHFRERVYGDLLGAEIQLSWPNGVVMAASFENFVDHFVYDETGTPSCEQDGLVEAVVNKFVNDRDALYALIREQGWTELSPQCWVSSYGPYSRNEPFPEIDDELAQQWSKVVISLVPWDLLYPPADVTAKSNNTTLTAI